MDSESSLKRNTGSHTRACPIRASKPLRLLTKFTTEKSTRGSFCSANMTNQFDEVWHTKDQGPIKVRDMKRSHVRNSLQWCLRRESDTIIGTDLDVVTGWKAWDTKDKDGLYYRDWIAIFTARLLDPTLGE